MKEILFVIGSILILGIVSLLCFCSCILASESDKFWEKTREGLEKRDERH
jgi:hypothetical protein